MGRAGEAGVSGAVAVGVFDGLHLGHLAILERVRARAAGGSCTALSFDPHPDVVLAGPFHTAPPLTPLSERRERLAALGIGLVVLPFTRELAALSAEEFVERHLVAPHAPRALVVGAGFALGRGRSGNVARLRELGARFGFEVEEVPLVERDGGPVSSTRIRSLLTGGRVAEAARLLGRGYSLSGTVVAGNGIGRALGYPTANLRLHEDKLVPGFGVYAGRARLATEAGWRSAAVSVGVRPTFGGRVPTIEAFLIDWSGELQGEGLEVEFVDWLRPELEFGSREALIAAMDADVIEARRRLGLAGKPAPC